MNEEKGFSRSRKEKSSFEKLNRKLVDDEIEGRGVLVQIKIFEEKWTFFLAEIFVFN